MYFLTTILTAKSVMLLECPGAARTTTGMCRRRRHGWPMQASQCTGTRA